MARCEGHAALSVGMLRVLTLGGKLLLSPPKQVVFTEGYEPSP